MSMMVVYQKAVADGTLRADPSQEAILPELERIRTQISQPVPKRGLFRKAPDPIEGLYMWGGVGVGKSMLMDLLVAQLDVPVERQHFHAFMQWVHAEMGEARKSGVDDAIAPVAKKLTDRIRLLAFDEMQITDITDAMIVGRLFEMLFDGGVTVLTTSNRPPDDLYKNGLNRQLFLPFIDLLKERLVVHDMASKTDYRQGLLSENATYFSPNDETAATALRTVWDGLTQGQSEPLVLRVKGRDVILPKFHNGVAWAKFFDLCGKPLGAADYLAISEAVRVLIIEDIPALSRQNFNEAKRFVTLIDALYEAKVKLIASAAAEPEMLYLEGEGTFEFERTASRLREMQSDSWGQ